MFPQLTEEDTPSLNKQEEEDDLTLSTLDSDAEFIDSPRKPKC